MCKSIIPLIEGFMALLNIYATETVQHFFFLFHFSNSLSFAICPDAYVYLAVFIYILYTIFVICGTIFHSSIHDIILKICKSL